MRTLKIMTVAALLAGLSISAAVFAATARPGNDDPFDAATYYKSKCVACHGQKAEKKFDSALTDEQLLGAVINGKKPEKPPNMPAYGEKGVTTEQAKALVEHMKQLKSAQ
jgi:mono/diheme cytochrome c family protein